MDIAVPSVRIWKQPYGTSGTISATHAAAETISSQKKANGKTAWKTRVSRKRRKICRTMATSMMEARLGGTKMCL